MTQAGIAGAGAVSGFFSDIGRFDVLSMDRRSGAVMHVDEFLGIFGEHVDAGFERGHSSTDVHPIKGRFRPWTGTHCQVACFDWSTILGFCDLRFRKFRLKFRG